jgi:uncharacterized membrane protein YedE/YeeE
MFRLKRLFEACAGLQHRFLTRIWNKFPKRRRAMYESLGFENLTAPQAAVIFAILLGLAFGMLAERTKFCFRRGLVGEDRRAAMGVWMTALVFAIAGTQAVVALEWISFADHRFMAADLPIAAIVIGGLLFGAGMVLTRGCVSRLTILTGSGNLRALMVLVVFAITAHAALKGVLAPLRVWLGGFSVDLGVTSLADLPGGALFWSLAVIVLALTLVLRSGNRPVALVGAAAIGLLVPLGWVGTGYVLYDDFDPIVMESLSFTAPWSEALFFTVASSAIPAGFGTGLVGGVLGGALLASLLFGSFAWQSFSTPGETGRYMSGAVMMGLGGTLAGGCTVGAGLAGIPSLSIAAILALASIAAGGLAMQRLLVLRPAPQAARAVPAE